MHCSGNNTFYGPEVPERLFGNGTTQTFDQAVRWATRPLLLPLLDEDNRQFGGSRLWIWVAASAACPSATLD
jgi:hypothetical protein